MKMGTFEIHYEYNLLHCKIRRLQKKKEYKQSLYNVPPISYTNNQ